MFTIIKNYKKLFLSLMISSLNAPSNIPDQITSKGLKDGDEGQDILQLQAAIKDGKIDKTEANIIVESINEINGEAKNSLNKLVNEFLNKGFIPSDKTEYDSYKKLLEKSDSKIIMPSFDDIMGELGFTFDNNLLKGIKVIGDKIHVRYDTLFDTRNTLEIGYNQSTGQIEESRWSDQANDHILFNEKLDLDKMDKKVIGEDYKKLLEKREEEEEERLQNELITRNAKKNEEQDQVDVILGEGVTRNAKKNEEQDQVDAILGEGVTRNAKDIIELGEETEKAFKDVKVILENFKKIIDGNTDSINNLGEQTEKALKDIKIILESHKESIDGNTDSINDLGEQTEKALKDIKVILENHKKVIDGNTDGINDLGEQTEKALNDVKTILKSLITEVTENTSVNARQDAEIAEMKKKVNENREGIVINGEVNQAQNETDAALLEATKINAAANATTQVQVDANSVAATDNAAAIVDSNDTPDVELLPGMERLYTKANKWYQKHGGVTDSGQIEQIKDILKDSGYKVTNIDGEFNEEFFNAVINYQNDNNLVKDGLVGRKTLNEMMLEHDGDFFDDNDRKKAQKFYGVR